MYRVISFGLRKTTHIHNIIFQLCIPPTVIGRVGQDKEPSLFLVLHSCYYLIVNMLISYITIIFNEHLL